MDTLNALQLTRDMDSYDAACKTILQNKELLSLILKYAVPEYEAYTTDEIVNFMGTVSSKTEVSNGRTNTEISSENTEFTILNEKTTKFDIFFKAKNPGLSTESILVNLYIDIEAQRNYKPGYPIEKRGIYYLAREISSQLSLLTEETDYNHLSKVYSIWICRDKIPRKEQYTLTQYSFENTKNIGNPVYTDSRDTDLMSLVIIRLGSKIYQENQELFRILNALFYPNQDKSFQTLREFIDFDEDLEKEAKRMLGFGQSILEEGRVEGRVEGRDEGIKLALKIMKLHGRELSVYEIADKLSLSPDYVEQIIAEWMEE